MNKQNTILFDIHYNTFFGQAVYIIGNIPELGSWDLAFAKKLNWHQVYNILFNIFLE
jgi:hypothetical protein